MSALDVSVVIPSHGRKLRLLWLLNALEEQALPMERFEVIVVHDYDDETAADVIGRHPLAVSGGLRQIRIPPGTGNPGRQRNLGWREARAPLVAFTDDDCRPDPSWLSSIIAAASLHPEAVLQGRTRPDPYENALTAAPHFRTLSVDPPGAFAQTCNIAYPRASLEASGGFDERLPAAAAEDLDLALRVCRDRTTGYVGVEDALVYHAVEAYSLAGMIRLNRKWQHVPYVVKKHPILRRRLPLRLFFRRSHFELCLALTGAAFARRHPAAATLALPYVRSAVERRGPARRQRAQSLLELPGQLAIDLADVAGLIRGSVKYRNLVL